MAFPTGRHTSGEDGLGCTIQINEKIKLLLEGTSTSMSSHGVSLPGMGNISQALMDCFYKNKLLVIEFRSLPSSSLLLKRPRQDPTEGRAGCRFLGGRRSSESPKIKGGEWGACPSRGQLKFHGCK